MLELDFFLSPRIENWRLNLEIRKTIHEHHNTAGVVHWGMGVCRIWLSLVTAASWVDQSIGLLDKADLYRYIQNLERGMMSKSRLPSRDGCLVEL